MPPSRLVRNFAILSAGELAAKFFTFFAYTYLGRLLGPERYGDVEFSLSAMLFFMVLVQLGLGTYGAREIARRPECAGRLLDEILEIRVWLSLASAALLCLFALVVPKPFEVKLLLVAYASSLAALPWMMLWFFQGLDAMEWVAAASFAHHAGFAAAVFAFVGEGTPLYWVGLCEALSVALAAAVCLAGSRRMGYGLPRPRLRPAAAWNHLRAAAPIALADLAWAGLWYSPLIVVGLLLHDASVGWFGSAHRVALALHTFVWWYFFNLLPAITRSVGGPREELRRLIGPSLDLAAWAGVGLALAAAPAPSALTAAAYGEQFAGAGPLLRVLMWTLALSALSGHYRFILLAFELQDRLLLWTAVAAVAAGGLTYALTDEFGAMAGAVGLVAGNLLLLLLCFATTWRRVARIGFAGAAVRPLLAAGVAFAVGSQFDHPWAAMAATGAVYCALFAVARRDLARELVVRLRGAR